MDPLQDPNVSLMATSSSPGARGPLSFGKSFHGGVSVERRTQINGHSVDELHDEYEDEFYEPESYEDEEDEMDVGPAPDYHKEDEEEDEELDFDTPRLAVLSLSGSQPMPSLSQPQLTVVLHSSPGRQTYETLLDNDAMNGGAHQQHEDEDEDDDQNGLIQSDLIDQHKRKKQSKSFPPAVSPSSLRQVSTPSGTPEPRKRTAPDTTPSGATPRPQKRPSLPPWVPQIRSGNQPDPAGPSSHPPGAKKRGRSKGWRPGQRSYASARPFDPSAPPQDRPPKPKKSVGKLKRRGRPPRNPSPTPRQIYDSLKPRFVPFLCEWQGCPASLHNFETLRRHVLNVHGREKGILTCKWGKCRPAASPSTPVIEFETDEAFPAHVDKEHLIPLRWIMGDGPQNTSVNSDVPRGGPYAAMAGDADPLPRYLFSADGKKQITPSIKEFEYENDEDLKKRKRMVEKLLQKQQENAPEEPTYTQAEVEVIAAGLDETNAKKKMFEEYTARVCGTKTHGPVYGEEWRGTLVGGRKERR